MAGLDAACTPSLGCPLILGHALYDGIVSVADLRPSTCSRLLARDRPAALSCPTTSKDWIVHTIRPLTTGGAARSRDPK